MNEYNNGMDIHFYSAEGISRKKFETFEEWLRNNNKHSDYNGAFESAESEIFKSCLCPEKFKEVCQDNRIYIYRALNF